MIDLMIRDAMRGIAAVAFALTSLAVMAEEAQVFDVDGIKYMVLEQEGNAAPAVKMCCPTAEGREYVLPLDSDGALTVPSRVSYNGVDYAVKEIETGTFYEDSSIRSVTLPGSLTKVDYNLCSSCENLWNIDLSDVLEVEWNGVGMHELPSLKVLTLPTTLKYAVIFSFDGGYNLERLYLPKNYGANTYYMTSLTFMMSLKEIYSPSTQPPAFDSGVDSHSGEYELPHEYWYLFGNRRLWENQPVIYVPIGAAEAYRNSASWCIYNDIREIDFASVDAVVKDSATDRLTLSGGCIVAPGGEEVTVYDLSGRMVANRDLEPGIYIVSVGNRSVKFAVRR